MFQARCVLDSIAPSGRRLTTMLWTYPRFIHAEILTHRDRARNSASSRAIPWPKMMAAINDDPVIPIRFGSEQKGMQTGCEIDDPAEAQRTWLSARDNTVYCAQKLAAMGVHKSICNRLTEPFMWITVVMTATEWNNLWRLRCHPDAEIHFQKIAGMAREAYEASIPERKAIGEWHLPFVSNHPDAEALFASCDIEQVKKISVARCARVSYLTQDGIRDPKKDIELFDRLVQGSGFGHFSPHEHVAQPTDDPNERSGPFVGWRQFRKEFPLENSVG